MISLRLASSRIMGMGSPSGEIVGAGAARDSIPLRKLSVRANRHGSCNELLRMEATQVRTWRRGEAPQPVSVNPQRVRAVSPDAPLADLERVRRLAHLLDAQ